ncbi:MAG: hypothetical protein HeimC3_47490 [Candidatus Heimdallarchaeota archaeon LC_3]|nr:MAG: hypothetical protein HeimC3_47490 [Candidatus Heimdallarchaeota archaeon LC_3]
MLTGHERNLEKNKILTLKHFDKENNLIGKNLALFHSWINIVNINYIKYYQSISFDNTDEVLNKIKSFFPILMLLSNFSNLYDSFVCWKNSSTTSFYSIVGTVYENILTILFLNSHSIDESLKDLFIKHIQNENNVIYGIPTTEELAKIFEKEIFPPLLFILSNQKMDSEKQKEMIEIAKKEYMKPNIVEITDEDKIQFRNNRYFGASVFLNNIYSEDDIKDKNKMFYKELSHNSHANWIRIFKNEFDEKESLRQINIILNLLLNSIQLIKNLYPSELEKVQNMVDNSIKEIAENCHELFDFILLPN